MITNTLVLGGLGQAGTLLAKSLRDSGITVTLVDLRPQEENVVSGMRFLRSDIGQCGPELMSALAGSDCVCVCLPEKITLRAALALTAAMPDRCLWVDTLSIKSNIAQAIAREAGRLEMLSINPMFAPALGWAGHAVAVVGLSTGSKSTFVKQLLTQWGARVEELSAEEHDRLTGAVQVATHAAVLSFGAALLQLKFDVDKALRIATPPHKLLLTLVHRMATQNAEVYWDLQAYHPLACVVRKELIRTLETIQEDAAHDDPETLKSTLEDLRALLAPQEEVLARWLEHAFLLVRQ
jgi:4-amino-4-deoxyprephenate dehydrogenase